MKEFNVIARYFQNHQHGRSDVIIGSGDDAAVLKPPEDQLLVSTIDMMVEGVHFFKNTPIENIAYKSIAISLSDLAAMGAEPAWVVATLSVPEVEDDWMKQFSSGFFELIDEFNLALVGGDLVKGPFTVTTQLTGFVPPNKMIKRIGAKAGDKIYVTGTIGDARTALELLKQQKNPSDFLQRRLERPTPRVKEGIALREIATSAIDLSDGLLVDLKHLLESEKLGADVDVNLIPRTDEVTDIQLVLNSGDDFELCFTLPPGVEPPIECTCIGLINDSGEIRCFDNGNEVAVENLSWQHF